MTQLLTVHHPCRVDLDCAPGVPVPGPASLDLVKYLFSVRGKSVLDLGCGGGLFAIAAARLGAAEVWATDASPAAIDCARLNAERNGVDIVAKVGAMFEAVADRAFDLIVSVPKDARGLDAVLRELPDHLESGGEFLTSVPAADASRFESLLGDRFRFRGLPSPSAEASARPYLAMKR